VKRGEEVKNPFQGSPRRERDANNETRPCGLKKKLLDVVVYEKGYRQGKRRGDLVGWRELSWKESGAIGVSVTHRSEKRKRKGEHSCFTGAEEGQIRSWVSLCSFNIARWNQTDQGNSSPPKLPFVKQKIGRRSTGLRGTHGTGTCGRKKWVPGGTGEKPSGESCHNYKQGEKTILQFFKRKS